MCLEIPLKIKKINNEVAKLEDGREVKLDLVPEAKVGDYILAQANYAVEVVDKKDAKRTNNLIKKLQKD